jgi:hypothetical protein
MFFLRPILKVAFMAAALSGVAAGGGTWTLSTGTWDDALAWDDTQNWDDG